MPSSPHIYISSRQIKYGQYTTDKTTNERVWSKYQHTILKQKDGTPLPMSRIYLPVLTKREKVHGEKALSFGVDKNGIDLDSRQCYIQVPVAEIKDLSKSTKNGKALKVIYFNNPNAKFTVYFEAKKYDVDRNHPNWNHYDNPEKIKVGVNELLKSFPTTKEEIKRAASQKEITKTSPEQEIKKEIVKDHQQKKDSIKRMRDRSI